MIDFMALILSSRCVELTMLNVFFCGSLAARGSDGEPGKKPPGAGADPHEPLLGDAYVF